MKIIDKNVGNDLWLEFKKSLSCY